MGISAILFYISCAGIVTMLSLKAYELKSGKKSWLSFISERTDKFVISAYRNTRRFILYINRRSAIALIQLIAYYILSWTRSVYIWIRAKAHTYPHSKKVLDMVRGKGEVESGGASFYLKKISDDGHQVEKKV